MTSPALAAQAQPCRTPASCTAVQKTVQAKVAVDPALAASVAAAMPSTVATTLSGAYADTMYGSDYGMQCNGISDDTAALNSVLTAAEANSGAANAMASGVKVVLPGGLCLISGEIDVAVTKSIYVAGLGIGSTHLQWTAPTNGLMFVVSNNASLTISDMAISKKVGTNPSGSTFVGQAVSIAAGGPDVTMYNTYLPRNQNTGSVTVANLSIYPGVPNGQTDSWAVGVHLTDLQGPTVENVSVNMPSYSLLPNPKGLPSPASPLPSPTAPGPFDNGAALPTSGTTAAGSPAASLGIGVSDGILIQGTDATQADPNAMGYNTDAVISDVNTTGGLVGLDFYRFQGAYVSSFKSVAQGIGIRADTPANVTELLSVMNSEFTDAIDGVYANGVAGSNLSGNYFMHSDASTPGLPAYAAIWIRNGATNTISQNNINGDGKNSLASEYGIWLSNDASDGSGGFPNTETGNVLDGLNGICLGNDKNVTAINATGNSMKNCGTYIADGAANIPYWGDYNSYVDNISNTPDMMENSNGLQLPEALTVGSFADVGSIKVLSDNLQTFLLDGSGNLTNAGNLTTGGAITSSGGVSTGGALSAAGTISTGNLHHMVVDEAVGGWGNGGYLISLQPTSGSLPVLSNVAVMTYGEIYCVSPGFRMAWRVNGHWLVSGSTATVQEFQAVAETDSDTKWSQETLTGTSAITPQAMPNAPGVQVAVGQAFSMTLDCTGDLHEMIVD